MLTALTIGLGGSLGAVFRYWVSEWIKARCSPRLFPWATFTVNVTGSFVMGILLGSFQAGSISSALAHSHPLTTGFLGGYTTFSTFAVEWLTLWQTKNRLTAMLYLSLSGAIGLLACWTGYALMR
ncbi:fluoride efflux transporter CrcB [Laceyella putida]|uniref:Fluoride-specific ion channel FluC n=1 Tax=Laceyella putida TaxID=110101 RepID=A0ABW2RNC8_9BACL